VCRLEKKGKKCRPHQREEGELNLQSLQPHHLTCVRGKRKKEKNNRSSSTITRRILRKRETLLTSSRVNPGKGKRTGECRVHRLMPEKGGERKPFLGSVQKATKLSNRKGESLPSFPFAKKGEGHGVFCDARRGTCRPSDIEKKKMS